MAKTLVSLGANLGNARQVMQQAGKMISNRFGESNVVFSRLYQTPAVGGPAGQDDFYNAVATIESSETAFGVWRGLNSIEQALGRQRRERWEARRIDLDVLLHDIEIHWTPTLKIPHPRMVTRTFVLEPAHEVAADWIEPVTGRTMASLCDSLRQIQHHERDQASSVHFLVLSENISRTERMAHATFEAAKQNAESSHAKATASLTHGDSHRITVQFDDRRLITFQTSMSLSRPASKSQIEELRDQLNRHVIAFQAGYPLQLLVFAGASPDPAVIHWEDYCRSWAELLGLVPSAEFTSNANAFRHVPKYLLVADDPAWAVHELNAAMSAMTCPIQPCGAFFDD